MFKRTVAAAILAAAGWAGSANAATLTTSGSIAPVCDVSVSPRTFDAAKSTIQNIAGIVVKCNQPGAKSLTVDAQNGQFNGPTNLDYLMTVDLDGSLLPFNNDNLGTAPVSRPIGAPDANVAAGLPGDISVTLLNTAFLAGTYSESWAITVG